MCNTTGYIAGNLSYESKLYIGLIVDDADVSMLVFTK